MKAITHISFGILSLGLLSGITHCSLTKGNIIAASIASILADIDTTKSTLGRIFYHFSFALEDRFGHRTITHSLLFCGFLALILLPVYFMSSSIYFSFLIGYFSHLIIDCLNKTGVPLLWPNKLAFVFPGKASWRIEVGSSAETILCICIITLASLTWYLNGLGVRSVFNNFLGTPELFVSEYKANADKFRMNLKVIDGFYTASQSPIHHETFEIIAAIDDKTLLVKAPEGYLITVGNSLKDTLQAQRGIIEKLEPITVYTHKFKFSGHKLGLMLPKLPNDCFITGTIEAHDRPKYIKMRLQPFKSGEFESIKVSSGLTEFDTNIEFNHASLNRVKVLNEVSASGELIARKLLQNNELTNSLNKEITN